MGQIAATSDDAELISASDSRRRGEIFTLDRTGGKETTPELVDWRRRGGRIDLIADVFPSSLPRIPPTSPVDFRAMVEREKESL